MEYDVIQESWKDHLTESDFWEVEDVKVPILSHRGVERLAKHFNVVVSYFDWVSSDPDFLLLMIGVNFLGGPKESTVYEVGEANSDNLGDDISSLYPASMAWKRGYDRAVLKLLGIEAYSAEEASGFKKKGNKFSQPIQVWSPPIDTHTQNTISQSASIQLTQQPPQIKINVPTLEPSIGGKSNANTGGNVAWVQPQIQSVQPIYPAQVAQATPSFQVPLVQAPNLPNPPVNATPVVMPQTQPQPITQPQENAILRTGEMLERKYREVHNSVFDLSQEIHSLTGKQLKELTKEEAGDVIKHLGALISK